MAVIIILIALALIGMAGIAIVNASLFPRLKTQPVLANALKVSVLIPARNEAAVIEQTVKSLLAQTYSTFEIIVLDDDSSDGTAELARQAGQDAPNLRVLQGAPLPSGWLGKNWACHQLAQAANGEYLIFTDADVHWSPAALSSLVDRLVNSQADLLTVWPTQTTQTWGERLVVPLMALVVVGYLPLLLVHHSPSRLFAAANGQCLAFRRTAYTALGGHAAVRNQIVEDVALARQIKAHTLRLRMVDGAGLIACRMYPDWSAVRDGFAKNILAGYGNSLLFLGLTTLFHWLAFVFPWLLFILSDEWRTWALPLITLGIGVRALTAAVTRQRVFDALLMPFSVVLMTHIALRSVWWRWRFGGARWKGRTIVWSAPHG